MMKKASALFFGIFIFASFAAAADNTAAKAPKEKTVKTVSIKKVKENYHKDLETLISKYNSSSEKEKVLIKNEIVTLVSQYTEKDLSYKKEKLAKDTAKAAKLEKEIAGIENNKEAYINKEVDFYMSSEGRKKLMEINEKEEKRTEKKNLGKK